MYKKSSDRLDHIERTGSHATKAHASGLIDDIPGWAAEPEQYYNSIRDRWKSILDQLMAAQSEIAGINEKLRHTLPIKEYTYLIQHKERVLERFHVLEKEQVEYRPLAKAAGDRAWAMVFYYLARKMMPLEDFIVIDKEVREILGRTMAEIKKGQGMMSEQRHASVVRHERKKDRRADFRKWYGRDRLAWADNKPVEQKYSDEIKSAQRLDASHTTGTTTAKE